MRVYTFQAYGPALLGDDKLDIPSGPRIAWNEAPPNRGYWKVGDRCYSINPLNPTLSWVCVAEGTPGTWVVSDIVSANPGLILRDSGVLNPSGENYTWSGSSYCGRAQAGRYNFTNFPNWGGTTVEELMVVTPPLIGAFDPYTEYTYAGIYNKTNSSFDIIIQRGLGGATVDVNGWPLAIQIFQLVLP